MFGLRGGDWGRVGTMALLGLAPCLLFGCLLSQETWDHFFYPYLWKWLDPYYRRPGQVNMHVPFILCVHAFVSMSPPFFASALILRFYSPQEGRIPLSSQALLAVLTGLFLGGVRAGLAHFLVDQPERAEWASFRLALTMALAWNLTWALDTVRRRRRALDAQAGQGILKTP